MKTIITLLIIVVAFFAQKPNAIEKGINFEYNHQTDTLETFDPPPSTFYHEKEMYWTSWPDGVAKVLITYKASQNLKGKMKQYSDEQYALGN